MAGVLTKAERVQIITTMTSKEFSPAITWYERALVCYELTVQAYEQRLTVYEAQESTNAIGGRAPWTSREWRSPGKIKA
jgi:hypothetical protein